ncbi:hypothetical protein V6R21_00960 [Limibacter armeniacum]|uniref:hypothetical protein n=1 Tax=Limibacter armeniacum TaxID=466084 RepID=UPI002FE60A3C
MNYKNYQLFSIIFIVCLLSSFNSFAAEKGLFTLQFIWQKGTVGERHTVLVHLEKGKVIPKVIEKKTYGNQMLVMELPEGEYNITHLEIRGGSSISFGEFLKLDFNNTVTVQPGKVVNGGLIYIGHGDKESKKKEAIYYLALDNTKDVYTHINRFFPAYKLSHENEVVQAWQYSDEAKQNQLIDLYEQAMVNYEKKNSRPEVTYLFGKFGLLLKLNKDEQGNILSYERLTTNTLRQVVKAEKYYGKLLITFVGNEYLYGPEDHLQFITFPEGVYDVFDPKLIGEDKFLVYDGNVNIYVANGFPLKWEKNSQFSREYDEYNRPRFAYGKEHMFIYTPNVKDDWALLSSSYLDVNFESVKIDSEIKFFSNVQETSTKLLLGPKTHTLVRKGAEIYMKDKATGKWTIVIAPRGDCSGVLLDQKNDQLIVVSCGSGTIKYYSQDGGQSWNKLPDSN